MARSTTQTKKVKKCRERYGDRCAITGTPEKYGKKVSVLEVHHIIPLELEGSWDDANLIPLRRDVHKAVHAPMQRWMRQMNNFLPKQVKAIEKLRKAIQVRKDKVG